jgi:hypothetical protein
VKRILIALVLGSLLALSAASVAAAKVTGIGHPDAEIVPDSDWAPAVIELGSRLSARLRAIDAVLYPHEVYVPECWADVDPMYVPMYEAADTLSEIADTDGYYLAYF